MTVEDCCSLAPGDRHLSNLVLARLPSVYPPKHSYKMTLLTSLFLHWQGPKARRLSKQPVLPPRPEEVPEVGAGS